jgi:hypothetical protein
LFLDAEGSVRAEGRLSAGKPIPSKFQLTLLAGKWSDEVGIVFAGNRAKETVLPTFAAPSADYVPIKDGDRVGASDPMTALLVIPADLMRSADVRFAPESDQIADIELGLFGARRRHRATSLLARFIVNVWVSSAIAH